MQTFDLILLLLSVVLVSSLLDQLLTKLALPLVQILIGVVLAAILGRPLRILSTPDLFLVLFIAPLLFDESRKINKQLFVRNLGNILSLAIGLVIVSTLVVGFALHWMAPSIPLAGAFAFGAMLGPTDAAAVTALSRSLQLNTRQKSLLSGEALINDASGIVSFQFAAAALTTGAFHLAQAGLSFGISFFGGLFTGAALGLLAVVILRFVRAIGFESTVFHVVFELLSPFIIFLVTEEVHGSGILGVVAAGLIMTLFPQLRSSYQARVKLVSSSVWEVLTFVINGIVFVVLGMQLPSLMRHSWDHATNPISLVGLIVASTVIMVAIRFGWLLLLEIRYRVRTAKRKGSKPNLRWKRMLRDVAVTALAGPKGAITLSIAFTLPYTVAGGDLFTQHDELIFLASGVIVLTLLLANFIVPILAPKADNSERDSELARIHAEILNKVIRTLREQSTAQTAMPVSIVVNEYKLQIREIAGDDEHTAMIQQLRAEVIADQELYLQDLKESESIDSDTARACAVILRRNLATVTSGRRRGIFTALLFSQAQQWRGRSQSQRSANAKLGAQRFSKVRSAQILLEVRAVQYLERVAQGSGEDRAKAANRLKADHEVLLRMYRRQRQMAGDSKGRSAPDRAELWDSVRLVEERGFQLELSFIQELYESGKLTRAQAARFRNSVYMMQLNAAESYH